MDDIAHLARAIDQARGTAPADVVLKGGRIFDLVTGDLTTGDVALCGDRIVGTGGDYRGAREIDARGKVVVPGFIDTHLHVESSLVTPGEFDRCVLPHGVTTAICDPHEIANVLGAEGLRYFLDWAAETVMDLRVQLSSCVPATDLETSGRTARGSRPAPLADHPKVIGLAEFMNYPGRAGQGPERAREARRLRRPPHRRPRAAGRRARPRRLSARPASAPTTRPRPRAEAREKLAKGMTVLVREGSVSKDLHALAPLITARPRAVHGLLHRRPQSARHRRGGPPRLHDPHRDPPRCAPARRLPDGGDLGRARLRPARPGPGGARAAGPTWCSSTISTAAPSPRVLAPGGWSTRPCSRTRRTVAPVGRRSVKAPTVAADGFRGAGRKQRRVGHRRAAGQDHHRAPQDGAAGARRRTRRRSRARRRQGRGGRAARPQRQYRARLSCTASA